MATGRELDREHSFLAQTAKTSTNSAMFYFVALVRARQHA